MDKEAQRTIDRYVGQQLRKYRIQAGVSQQALGEKLGVTFQQVQKYEKGDNRMGASRLVAIAEILGIPLIKLFEGCPDPYNTEQASQAVQKSALDAPMSGVLGKPDVREAMSDLVSVLARSE